MLVGPCTSTGTSDRPLVVLRPSLPEKLAPHVHTVPSDLRTIVPRAPPQRETTSAACAIESDKTSRPPATSALQKINLRKIRHGHRWGRIFIRSWAGMAS